MRFVPAFLALSALAACSPYNDYQGVSPAAYEAYHPKENTVETLYDSYMVYFTNGKNTLTDDARANLDEFLAPVSPDGVERVNIHMRSRNDTRGHALLRELRKRGFAKRSVLFSVSPEVPADAARMDITYTVAVAPEGCPDWHKSARVNYSNTLHSNMRCATNTNLGMMVADPRDLQGHTGRVNPDPHRNSLVLEKYRTDLKFGAVSAGSAESASSGAAATAPSK